MCEATAKIGAAGVDTDAILQDAENTVARKQADGTYTAAGLNTEKSFDPIQFRNDEAFLAFFLESLRETAFVDISDFRIEEKRRGLGRLLVLLKKVIWNLLKFYTYRLWSQQNEVNGLLLSAIEGIHDRHQEQVQALEARIAMLESGGQKST